VGRSRVAGLLPESCPPAPGACQRAGKLLRDEAKQQGASREGRQVGSSATTTPPIQRHPAPLALNHPRRIAVPCPGHRPHSPGRKLGYE
jgi:hypothetical protein